MRRILAMSMAASVPAILPAVAAGAQSRPAPPAMRTHHHRLAHRPWATHDRRHERPSIGAPAVVGAPVHDRGVAKSELARPRAQLLSLGSPAPAAPSTAGSPAGSSAAPTSPSALTPNAAPGRAQAPGGENGRDHRNAPTRLILKTTMGSAAPRTVTLLCDPPGGAHPKAAQACADLARSRGDFSLPSSGRKPRACFMIYSPVTVSAEGRWRGEDVRFTAHYPNTCVMRGQTGAVFDF